MKIEQAPKKSLRIQIDASENNWSLIGKAFVSGCAAAAIYVFIYALFSLEF